MIHLDLFSGIGGFALAARWAGFETVAFVEIDKFCQKVLAKNFPWVPIYEDITKIQWVVADTPSNGGGSIQNGNGDQQSIGDKSCVAIRGAINLLTGGFPCQPFSCAGKRAGTEDDRYLWPEMLRTIHEVKPRWILAENVPGLLTLQNGVVFEGVCADLEAEGYEVLPLIIPACAQGAPHRRDRVWIVAHAIGTGTRGEGGSASNESGRTGESGREGIRPTNGTSCSGGASSADCHAPDTEGNTERPGLCQGEPGREWRGRFGNETWKEHWYAAAARLCGIPYGLPRGMDRVNRLKALGNSIVPQVAYEIIKAIREMEEGL